jgi:iron transport multicopper oxidase
MEISIDESPHPIHIHGHNVQLAARGAGVYTHSNVNNTISEWDSFSNQFINRENHVVFNSTPMRRDTWFINPLSFYIVRFRADNPGVWLLHCHMEWHMDAVSVPHTSSW